MTRGSWLGALVIVAGCAGVFGYFDAPSATHSPIAAEIEPGTVDGARADRESAPAALHEAAAKADANQLIVAEPIAVGKNALEPLSTEAVARLIKEVTDDNPGTRASAIDALAAAPESAAVPVLQKVLNGGGDMDRQLALSSLYTIARNHGDATGGIRETLRQAIYDGGDEAVASGAQAALEDIERDTGQIPPESQP